MANGNAVADASKNEPSSVVFSCDPSIAIEAATIARVWESFLVAIMHEPRPIMETQPATQELLWSEQHPDALASYGNQWVAILGSDVIASGASFEDVHDQLAPRDRSQALIMHVPDDIDKWDHLVA